jgi:hypothetical protein
MRAPRQSDERGIALAVAVFALVVIAALIAGTFFAGRLEQQTGMNTFFGAQAAEAAEAGLNNAIKQQTAAAMLALPIDPGTEANIGTFTVNGKLGASRTISRLTDNLFLVRSRATRVDAAGGQLAKQSLGQLIRLVQPQISVKAGLTARGDVKVTGGAEVTGIDGVPPLWASQGVTCPPTADVTGVRYNNGTITTSGQGTVAGVPPDQLDPTLTAQEMQDNFNKLKALATLILTTGNPAATVPAYTATVPVRCNTAVQTNWGEPTLSTDPCFNYFPIIYYQGDLRLQGGRGQGILLVEGDLTATGGMVFYGPVYVTGTLSTEGNSGQGAKFFGGVIAGNVALDDLTKLAGGALVSYSSCALRRALQGTAKPGMLAERSWVQLYQ